MRTIWKFPCLIEREVLDIAMPEGAEILCVQMQDDIPCIWAMVETSKMKILHRFVWRGTGWSCSEGKNEKYVGTVQLKNGLVFHLFYLGLS